MPRAQQTAARAAPGATKVLASCMGCDVTELPPQRALRWADQSPLSSLGFSTFRKRTVRFAGGLPGWAIASSMVDDGVMTVIRINAITVPEGGGRGAGPPIR